MTSADESEESGKKGLSSVSGSMSKGKTGSFIFTLIYMNMNTSRGPRIARGVENTKLFYSCKSNAAMVKVKLLVYVNCFVFVFVFVCFSQ